MIETSVRIIRNTRHTRFYAKVPGQFKMCGCFIDQNRNVGCTCVDAQNEHSMELEASTLIIVPVLFVLAKSPFFSIVITPGPHVSYNNEAYATFTFDGTTAYFETRQNYNRVKSIDWANVTYTDCNARNIQVEHTQEYARFSQQVNDSAAFFSVLIKLDVLGYEVPQPFASVVIRGNDKNHVRFAPTGLHKELLDAIASTFCGDQKIRDFKPPMGVCSLCNGTNKVDIQGNAEIYVQFIHAGRAHECTTTTECTFTLPTPSPPGPFGVPLWVWIALIVLLIIIVFLLTG